MRLLAVLTLATLAACSGMATGDDSGVPDSGMPQPDSGQQPPPNDSGVPDSGSTLPMDAGVPDAGPFDAGAPDAGAVACQALLCEDFEGKVLDSGVWTVDEGYTAASTMTVDSTVFAHGAHSAHAHVTGTDQGHAYLEETQTFPALKDGLWGRASFMTDIPSSAGHTAFASVLNGTQSLLEVGISNGKWQLTFYEPGQEHPVGYNTSVPVHEWVCLEWHLQRNADPLIEVFIDGGSAAKYGYTNQSVPEFTQLRFGFENHSVNDGGTDSYWDDVAINDARIGCP